MIAIISVLTCMATWGSAHLVSGWQLKRAGHQVLEDLKAAQGKAESFGSMVVSNGTLVMQRMFLVFDPEATSYTAYLWQDHNGNGAAEAGEADPVWQKGLPPGISFGWEEDINRRACSNVNRSPGSAVSFASPDYTPCGDRPCIKFDQYGFSVMGSGAIYMTEGDQTLAITGTRSGHFTMCEWDGGRWK